MILIFGGILISSFTSEHLAHAQTLEDTTDLDDPDPEEGVEDDDEGIAYQTLFESDLDADLLELLEENAKLLTLSDPVLEVLAYDVLHREVRDAALLADGIYLYDILVDQARRALGLAVEALHGVLVGRHALRQHL